jgi:hypothetical protein
MATGFLDAMGFRATSSGTGDFVPTAALSGYRTPAGAGAVNGTIYTYRAESDDLSEWEIGEGAYTSAGTTLARSSVIANSAGNTSKISFTAAPKVFCTVKAADALRLIQAPRGHIWGLTLSNDGTSPNTVLDMATGECASDATLPLMMTLASAYSKTTGAWAVGSGNGGLDTGSVAASTWYHVFVIMRPDTGVVDILFSTSATAPTLPTNYTHKRRIGSFKTNGSSQIIAFKQFEDNFYWSAPTQDSTTSPNTTDTAYTLNVPTGVRVEPFFHVNGQAATNAVYGKFRSPDLETTGASTNDTGLATFGLTANGSTATRSTGAHHRLLTNTSGQVNIVFGGSLAAFDLRTYGWCDTRGRLS